MSVTVRPIEAEDAERVADLAVKLARQHEEYDHFRFARLYDQIQAAKFYKSRVGEKSEAVLVAEIDNQIVGFAYLQYENKDYANLLENAAWLHDIYVEKSVRSSGAGKLLLDKSAETAQRWGADKLMLSVAAKNSVAQEYFSRYGFRETMIEMMLDLNAKR